MSTSNNQNIIVLGASLEGWLVAAKLSKELINSPLKISLIEQPVLNDYSPITHCDPEVIALFNEIGVPLAKLLAECDAEFILGSQYNNNGEDSEKLFVSHSAFGMPMGIFDAHQFLIKANIDGHKLSPSDVSLAAKMASEKRMGMPGGNPNLGEVLAAQFSELKYSLVANTEKLKALLKQVAVQAGVTLVSDQVNQLLRKESSNEYFIKFESQQTLEADLIVDCTGDAGDWYAIDDAFNWEAFGTASKTYAHYQSSEKQSCNLFTEVKQVDGSNCEGGFIKITASESEQTCSAYAEQSKEQDKVFQEDGYELLSQYQVEEGRRSAFWHGNLLMLGKSAINYEHLFSGYLDEVCFAIKRLIGLLPATGDCRIQSEEYNRLVNKYSNSRREFHELLNYAVSSTNKNIENTQMDTKLSESLQSKVALFACQGKVILDEYSPYTANQWAGVFLSMGIMPKTYHPLLDAISEQAFEQRTTGLVKMLDCVVEQMPEYQQFKERIIGRS